MAGSSNFITFFILTISVCVKEYLCVEYPVGRHCKINHPVKELSKENVLKYGQLDGETHLRDAVETILKARVDSTSGINEVRKYISDSLCQMGWFVEYDVFQLGREHFINMIAKLNPNAKRFLVLTCHYDRNYFKYNKFVGDIDAVPCAMLLNMAHVLQAALKQFRKTELSLMFIFFDGEEAMDKWGPRGSVYGARHLANRWAEDGNLDKLDILVDLDLIGSSDSTFYSFFENTDTWFSRFITLETRLSNAEMLHTSENPKRYFEPIRSGYQQGDHLPFLEQNVPILHVTPTPFPKVDDESIISYAATEDISRIIRLFTMEYLLSGITN
ncbi:glutaminyl-peptide cyclotransferase-like [Eurosta solidaginis]|uniref:glutaminyl-peptide cyclotransferase-like n=1 Tax=Eurosta solidaginis TaxID=178769 RepID=UPI0035305A88